MEEVETPEEWVAAIKGAQVERGSYNARGFCELEVHGYQSAVYRDRAQRAREEDAELARRLDAVASAAEQVETYARRRIGN